MTDNDIAKSISQLRNKLARQEEAVKATKAMVEVLEQLLKTGAKPR